MALLSDPFTLLCPVCLSPIDPTDPAVEIEFDPSFAATAVCPTCETVLPLTRSDDGR